MKMIGEAKLKELIEKFQSRGFIQARREWFDKPMQEKVLSLLQKDRLLHVNLEDAQKLFNDMTVGGANENTKEFIH